MILCITEEPSVGRDIARIVGATASRDGYYEGNGYCVTWTFGHLCTLKEPADYTEEWKPCDEVVKCGDAGQEGEVIQRWVMQKAGCDRPVKRLWISSLTDEAIREGFRNLRPEKDLEQLYMAGICRAIGDWILGINATRLYTLKYSTGRQLLSVGRVQTPTLALIVQRQKEIEEFVPKDYWVLRTLYRGVWFTAEGKSFDSEEKAKIAADSIKDLALEITDVAKKSGREAPPRLFDLTSLQVECNKRYGLSADETLRTIQSLYEKKLTTYPRVDTTYLTDDMYPKCGPILNSLQGYQEVLQTIRGKKLPKSKKVFDNSKVTDHHAIIPTGVRLPDNLSLNERRVFDTVARRFVSVFFPDCRFEQTTVKAKAGKTGFKVTGKVITDPGWRVLYASQSKDNNTGGDKTEGNDEGEEENSKVLPEFSKGESGPHTPGLQKKTTQPPKYYTEGTLLKAMETAGSTVEDEDMREALKANGIGRPSTRAAIIEILFKRGYIVRERKSVKATQAGKDLIGIIREELLKSAKLTGIWEGRLRMIERGEYSAQEFIDRQKELILDITRTVMLDNSNRRVTTVTPIEQPPKGSKPVRKRKKAADK